MILFILTSMKCPNDQATLLITERSGIEIDYCPECRGVWLDRGELDKIIDKSEAPMQNGRPQEQPRQDYVREHDEYRQKHDYHDQKPYKKKRRESFIGDLFDF